MIVNISTRIISDKKTGRCVSTILRNSSAVLAPGKYYETIVWTLKDDKQLDMPIDQMESSGLSGAIINHQALIAKYCDDNPT